MNRFGRDFFQNCVDFHGGDDGSRFPGHWSIWSALQKKGWPAKKRHFSLDLSADRISLQRAYHMPSGKNPGFSPHQTNNPSRLGSVALD